MLALDLSPVRCNRLLDAMVLAMKVEVELETCARHRHQRSDDIVEK
jgi:hypothetical protein